MEMEELELPIRFRSLYQCNCGCVVNVDRNVDNQGKIMKKFVMGMFVHCCIDHQGLKNSWHRWGNDGKHKGPKRDHGGANAQRHDFRRRVEWSSGDYPTQVRL